MAIVHTGVPRMTGSHVLPTVSEEESDETPQTNEAVATAANVPTIARNASCSYEHNENDSSIGSTHPNSSTSLEIRPQDQNRMQFGSIGRAVCWNLMMRGRQPQPKTPNDFKFLKTIGEGPFSTIYLAQDVTTKKEYAIKVFLKEEVSRLKKIKSVMNERDALSILTYLRGGNPFVVSLYCSFTDPTRLYLAMTYGKNGDLHYYLRRLGSFEEHVTRFYAAEVVSALEFMHDCSIIHRDLKPENILLTEKMHIMICDFGSVKIVGYNEVGIGDEKIAVKKEDCDRSFVGTAQYFSPEALSHGDVGPPCDYWALGAIIFQMVSGLPPFRSINDYHTFQKIQKLDYSFPDGFPDLPKNLVQQFLMLDPRKRLGSSDMGGCAAVKAHPFFESVEWENLSYMTPPVLKPYVPASYGEPEYHSDYVNAEDIAPGLDQAAISRLMDSSFKEFSNTKAHDHRLERLKLQRERNKFHQFVEGNLIIKAGLLDKKKGLFPRRRMFLLTEGPHIYYVDPANMELKGEIPVSKMLRTEGKNFRTFFVHTPNRTYYLFDPERNAMDWCRAINELRDKYINVIPESADPPAKNKKNKLL